MKKAYKGYLLTAPAIAGGLLFYAVPFLRVIYYSMQRGSGKTSSFVGMDNYKNLIKNDMFRLACWNTFRFLVVGLIAVLVLSYGLALLLKFRVDKHRLLKSVFMAPYVMPVAGSVLLVELLFAKSGTLNGMLSILGISGQDWLESSWAFGVVLLLFLWKNTGYSVILLLAGLSAIPEAQYGAAQIDGAGAFQRFRYITVPQMWYSVFMAMLFSLINAFKCFRDIFLIGGKHPNSDIYMLQHFMNNSFESLNYAKLSVASVLLLLAVAIVIVPAYNWVRRKEEYRG